VEKREAEEEKGRCDCRRVRGNRVRKTQLVLLPLQMEEGALSYRK
jgi:hypothetical protein